MEEKEALKVAQDYVLKLNIEEKEVKAKYLIVKYRKMKNRLGTCYIADNMILLNKEFCLTSSTTEVKALIAHEVTHLQIANHNYQFAKVAEMLNPDTINRFDKAIASTNYTRIKIAMSRMF